MTANDDLSLMLPVMSRSLMNLTAAYPAAKREEPDDEGVLFLMGELGGRD